MMMSAVNALVRPRRIRCLVISLALLSAAFSTSASVFVSVSFAPPPIPVYEQPLCPGLGYIWVPGYWAYGPYGYYWVPGTWVLAPFIGALWTPGYWGWSGTVYVWHPGYWGRHVGFYGGIDYGYGYFGIGYSGGYWNHGALYYNAAVSHVDVTRVRYTYRSSVPHGARLSRVSYNGDPGGTSARPTSADRIAAHETHRPPTPVQVQHERLASRDRSLFASVNHGSPPLAATPRPGAFGRSNLRAGTVGETRASHAAPAPVTEVHGRPGEASSARREFGPGSESRVATPHGGRESRAESRAPNVAAPQHALPRGNREFRAASPGAFERRGEHRATHAAPRVASSQASGEYRVERGGANRGDRMRAPPRPEMHAQNAPRPQGPPREGHGGDGRHEQRRGG